MVRVGAMVGFLVLFGGCAGGNGPLRDGRDDRPEPEAPLEVELRANRIIFNHAIRFTRDSDVILPDSFIILDRVVALLAEHPNLIRVQVQGHTSTDGAAAHNRELSEARAVAVADYLRTQGVEQEVTSQGYGETYPVCHEQSLECEERNRRVEFFVDER